MKDIHKMTYIDENGLHPKQSQQFTIPYKIYNQMSILNYLIITPERKDDETDLNVLLKI